MAKRKSAPASTGSGVRYSLLFALVLVLLAFLLIFANSPSDEKRQGTEEVTGNLLYQSGSPIPKGEMFNTESSFWCEDSDIGLGSPESFLEQGYTEMVNRRDQRLKSSPVRTDYCIEKGDSVRIGESDRLVEMACTNGIPTYEVVRCANVLGLGARCVEGACTL